MGFKKKGKLAGTYKGSNADFYSMDTKPVKRNKGKKGSIF